MTGKSFDALGINPFASLAAIADQLERPMIRSNALRLSACQQRAMLKVWRDGPLSAVPRGYGRRGGAEVIAMTTARALYHAGLVHLSLGARSMMSLTGRGRRYAEALAGMLPPINCPEIPEG